MCVVGGGKVGGAQFTLSSKKNSFYLLDMHSLAIVVAVLVFIYLVSP